MTAGKRRRILVIDDEVHMLRILARLLSASYEVVVASSGQEGLELIAGGAHFDLVLCDLFMPRMGGMALFAQLKAARPELAARTVFMTGGALADDTRAFLEQLPGKVIEKPFDYRLLERMVSEVLAAPSEPPKITASSEPPKVIPR